MYQSLEASNAKSTVGVRSGHVVANLLDYDRLKQYSFINCTTDASLDSLNIEAITNDTA